jgi:hypothetical protein
MGAIEHITFHAKQSPFCGSGKTTEVSGYEPDKLIMFVQNHFRYPLLSNHLN